MALGRVNGGLGPAGGKVPGCSRALRAKAKGQPGWAAPIRPPGCFGEEVRRGRGTLAHAMPGVSGAGESPAHKSTALLPCPCNPQAQK